MSSSISWRGRAAIAVAVIGTSCLLLIVAVAQGWHRSLPGFSEDHIATSAGEHEHGDEHEHEHGDEHGNAHEHGDEHEHADAHEHGDAEGHEVQDQAEHDQTGHDEANSIKLSQAARRSLDLRTGAVEVGTFVRRISVPGTIVPWPGRTHITIAAPLTGTVTSVHVAPGQSVTSGAPLYTLRLTHQDLVRTQSEFLQRLGEADVERQEVARLQEAAQSGAIARRSFLERQYALERLEAELRAMRESLLLHGLDESQVQRIEDQRQLIREMTLFAPVLHQDRSLHSDVLEEAVTRPAEPQAVPGATQAPAGPGPTAPDDSDPHHIDVEFVVTELIAERGQSVSTGDPLTVLADYELLLAEGQAFQQDAEALIAAAETDAPVQAVFEGGGRSQRVIDGLQIAYVGSEVRTASRSLPFYVPLENEKVREELQGQRRYTSWLFKPGQRLQLRVPVDGVENVIVLPVEAVAQEGAEAYVFVESGDHFDRRTVEVVRRDQASIAIANSGALVPGETIALSDAHQLQMALKNSAGGGADPHAGHSH